MKYKLGIFITVLCLFVGSKTKAQEEKYIGLFIYNFTKYFDWPESMKSGDFVIDVIGHPSVYEELGRLTAGKKVGTQNIVLKKFDSAENLDKSNIIFVGHWQSRFMAQVLSQVGNNPTLIITESEGMLDKGAAINFVILNGTIKFEMNATAVKDRNLKTDPRLRQLAYRVVE